MRFRGWGYGFGIWDSGTYLGYILLASGVFDMGRVLDTIADARERMRRRMRRRVRSLPSFPW